MPPLLVSSPVSVDAPVTANVPASVVLPVTPSVPPNAVAPVPTVNVLDPDTDVLPFSVFAPVPVDSVDAPVWLMLDATVKLPLASVSSTVAPSADILNGFAVDVARVPIV